MFDLYRNTEHGDAVTYVRPYQTISTGPLNGNSTLTIFEEQITTLADDSVVRSGLDTPELFVEITDPTASFNLIHPVTGAVTGSMTFADLKIRMYSLYVHFANLRDAE